MTAYAWQKSSYCAQGESCVHISATTPATIHVTESTDPAQAVLTTGPVAFAALLGALKTAHITQH
ncbi:DUF397 domain-containing protein [Streptomyces blattellae]|uniref:DUF397 domain-containing protein n=1 Tax=Streptomyces blattellae TaxID=2569855 RepID=UPI0012B99FEB|nr:DUF397 domain-containing protein [Streptomyces blattellae]